MEPGDKMGFPPGIAESMVSECFAQLTCECTGLLLLQEVLRLTFQEIPFEARPRREMEGF
jgi:hypothetical protein